MKIKKIIGGKVLDIISVAREGRGWDREAIVLSYPLPKVSLGRKRALGISVDGKLFLYLINREEDGLQYGINIPVENMFGKVKELQGIKVANEASSWLAKYLVK